ncbi:helix-turn-helix domain-containing protein [Phocaeicola oris]|uniref:LuxR family transcriptional regulator n=1 Tax=Phocaeicola oris TaxID=2896850 RepID=UPI00234E5BB0|nr:LuxR family transcriptional regulator [Phocaeicola oris]MCE2616711.1 LuxR family transcriptional regulator [Phocaeicola oris]
MKRLLYLFVFALLFSCTSHDNSKKLQATDSLLFSHPDSALKILNELQNVGQMSEAGVMHYAWNHAMAHQQMGMSLEEDSLIPNAVSYYRQRNDTTKLLDGYLLKASYLRWTGKPKEALTELEKGIKEANIMHDDSKWIMLMVQKIEMLYRENDFRTAANTIRSMLAGHHPIDHTMGGKLLYALGLNLSLLNDPQANRYFEESIKLAQASQQMNIAAERMRNYSAALTEKSEFAKSNELLYHLRRLAPEYSDISAIMLSLANNYVNMHRLDSTQYFLEKAEESERILEAHGKSDLNRRANIELLRNIINFSKGKMISSLAFNRYCDSVTTAMIDKDNTSMRRLETRNSLQAANYALHQSALRLFLIIVLLLFLLLGGGGTVYWLYRRKYQRLAEAEESIETLKQMLREAQTATSENNLTDQVPTNTESNAFLKKVLLQQLGIIRLVAGTPTNQNQALLKRISAIGGGETPANDLLVWSDLYPIIDRLYHNFHSRLVENYGDKLIEKEIQICCLLCAEFSTKEIGVITQQTNATIYVRKSSIRKKLGMKESQDIVEFVNTI